jgi:hypothetical protein
MTEMANPPSMYVFGGCFSDCSHKTEILLSVKAVYFRHTPSEDFMKIYGSFIIYS